jgi:protocatechuate 3,4-dioxygenase beta subunit
MLRETTDQGTPLVVSGRITDAAGKLLKNATIEIWHTNPQGHYDLDGYIYRASIRANSEGQYTFETFLPGAYGGRAQHIHYKITAPSHQALITQLYFETDPTFEGNPETTYRKDPIISNVSLIRPVQGDNKSGLRVDFPICLG